MIPYALALGMGGALVGTIGLFRNWPSHPKDPKESKSEADSREESSGTQRLDREPAHGSEKCMVSVPFNDSDLCFTCNHVRLKTLFLEHLNSPMEVCWSYDYVTGHPESMDCNFCRLLRRVIEYHQRDFVLFSPNGGQIMIEIHNSAKLTRSCGSTTITVNGETGIVKLILSTGRSIDLSHTIVASRVTWPWNNKPLLHTSRNRVAIGNDTERVNFETIKRMIRYCLITHNTCAPKLIEPPAFFQSRRRRNAIKELLIPYQPRQMNVPFRLYDCVNQCLIVASKDPKQLKKYVALSYVWGNDRGTQLERVKLTKMHETQWQNPGGLPRHTLPPIIKDALKVTKELGLQYIWVDKLCIPQDEEDQTQEGLEAAKERRQSIDAMYWIYMNAYCTVVAPEASHSLDSIPGLETSPRSNSQATTIAGNIALATSPIYVGETIADSRWSKRPWTFQEMICSPRTIVFTKDTAIFCCGEGCRREDTGTEISIANHGSRLLEPITVFEKLIRLDESQKAANQKKYANHLMSWIRQYISREEPKPEDWERAFAGILGYVQPFLGESLSGNPRDMFHCSIAWYSDTLTGSREGFPSWSWTGWKYELDENRFSFNFTKPYLRFFTIERQPVSRSRLSISRSSRFTLTVTPFGLEPAESERPLRNFKLDDKRMISAIQKKLEYRHNLRGALKSPLIAFFTSIARLHLKRLTPKQDKPQIFAVLALDFKKQLTTIKLSSWQSIDDNKAKDFIVIEYMAKVGFRLLMIEWDEEKHRKGIAHRVQISDGHVSVHNWEGVAESTSQLIVMG
jgi:Heterokaryon incompatibility protein (HET)